MRIMIFRNGEKVLIFNQQGRPEAVNLLERLFKALHSEGVEKFYHVIFCTNVTYAQKGYKRGACTQK
jgi:folylpolyglutamate synthase